MSAFNDVKKKPPIIIYTLLYIYIVYIIQSHMYIYILKYIFMWKNDKKIK